MIQTRAHRARRTAGVPFKCEPCQDLLFATACRDPTLHTETSCAEHVAGVVGSNLALISRLFLVAMLLEILAMHLTTRSAPPPLHQPARSCSTPAPRLHERRWSVSPSRIEKTSYSLNSRSVSRARAPGGAASSSGRRRWPTPAARRSQPTSSSACAQTIHASVRPRPAPPPRHGARSARSIAPRPALETRRDPEPEREATPDTCARSAESPACFPSPDLKPHPPSTLSRAPAPAPPSGPPHAPSPPAPRPSRATARDRAAPRPQECLLGESRALAPLGAALAPPSDATNPRALDDGSAYV